MKTQTILASTLLCLSTLNPQLSTAFAQGSLAPPGAPGPTFKTLTQIEPRTAITNSGAVTISVPGSYYLTTNITVAAGDAITIAASGVTLDLNGFTISSTAPSATGTGILISGNRRNLTIKDGFIESGVTRSGGVFSGSGFAHGIFFANQPPLNVLVLRVSVAGVLVEGIDLGTGESTFVESCNARIVGGNGIVAGVVRDCVVRECGLDGVTGISVENCSAVVTGSGTGIKATSALNCHGTSASGGRGVDAYSANNCRGIAFTNGIGINATIATGCTGSSDRGTGVIATTAFNCYGSSSSGIGLDVRNASNCYGRSDSATALYAYIAIGCTGDSQSSYGLFAYIGNSCTGSGSPSLSVTWRYNMPP